MKCFSSFAMGDEIFLAFPEIPSTLVWIILSLTPKKINNAIFLDSSPFSIQENIPKSIKAELQSTSLDSQSVRKSSKTQNDKRIFLYDFIRTR